MKERPPQILHLAGGLFYFQVIPLAIRFNERQGLYSKK